MPENARKTLPRNTYVQMLKQAGEAWLTGDSAADLALSFHPVDAGIAWLKRERSDPWPAEAPWDVSTPWAQLALKLEGEEGMKLSEACNFIMLAECRKGRLSALAQWCRAGWTPTANVLMLLAGYLSPSDTLLDREGLELSARKRKKNEGQTIELTLRNPAIALRVRELMQSGSSYEDAVADVATEVNLSEDSVKGIYDKAAKSTTFQAPKQVKD